MSDVNPNVENEGVILGGIIKASPEVRARVVAKLTPNDFTYPGFKEVFEALVKLVEIGAEYHRDTVVQLSGDEVGLQTLAELERDFDELPESNFDAHVEILRDSAAKLAAAESFARLKEAMALPSARSSEAEEAALQVLRDLRGTGGGKLTVSGPDAVESTATEIRRRADGYHVPTYYAELDDVLTAGFRPGLVVIAARPSVGKSTFVSNLLLRQATHGKRWLSLPIEPGIDTVLEQMYCIATRTPFARFTRQATDVKEAEIERFRSTMLKHASFVDFIEQRLSFDRFMVELRAGGYVGAVVDLYEYLLPDVKPATITETLRAARSAAIEAGTCLVVVHQIKRLENRRKKDGINPENLRPTKEDLKHSGGYEEVADLVLLLHRNAAVDPEWDSNVLEIKVAKQKVGQAGRVYCYEFEPEICRVGDFRTVMSWNV